MKIYRGLGSLPARLNPSSVTIGNYDGVHRGHQAVIRRLHSHAEDSASVPTVLTFDPHPQSFLHGAAPPALASWEDKVDLLREHGIERLCVLEFDARLASMEPETFIEEVLVGRLDVRSVVVGSNFRFGRFARGDTTMLRRFGRQSGFAFNSVRVARLGGRTVSSTEIRHAVAAGDLVWANLALGRQFRLRGTVVEGAGRGRELGFPTANVDVPSGLCMPAVGIYGGWVAVGRTRPHLAAISVGTNPTFGVNPVTVEAHLIDARLDLYGKEAVVHFESFIRKEKKFSSSAALKKAIGQDISTVRHQARTWSPPARGGAAVSRG